jgi:NAD(P)-dependent dehydrogenase (short-subunit alcohol dehydrogenase family)
MPFTGRTALITAASPGIGEVFAREPAGTYGRYETIE